MKVSGEIHAPAALPLRRETPIPLDRRLGGTQSWFGSCGVEKNLSPLPGIEP
jgi:hypothetical protein